MDPLEMSMIIESYPLEDCIAVLAISAPHMLEFIEQDLILRRDDPQTLKKARRLIYDALAQERMRN